MGTPSNGQRLTITGIMQWFSNLGVCVCVCVCARARTRVRVCVFSNVLTPWGLDKPRENGPSRAVSFWAFELASHMQTNPTNALLYQALTFRVTTPLP